MTIRTHGIDGIHTTPTYDELMIIQGAEQAGPTWAEQDAADASIRNQHTANQVFTAVGFFFIASNPELWPLALVGAGITAYTNRRINHN